MRWVGEDMQKLHLEDSSRGLNRLLFKFLFQLFPLPYLPGPFSLCSQTLASDASPLKYFAVMFGTVSFVR